ncbi:hypothetical protein OS493_001852 [Desmophyllum pertusum]|uniref:Uncharacterized protein n=1 Tax=Desmophyllum pertusum TaxID=174260 RepID=A0A9W9Z556_9CNID|nr:hypothetical protein OS493_001852 [Desmophyllum pertusum]
MLVHGRAVCNELFPISIFEDIAQDQNANDNNDTEPAQRNAIVNVANDVQWIKDEIVDFYGFRKHNTKVEWESQHGQPTFEGKLGTNSFMAAGNRAKEFFQLDENNDWDNLKQRPRLDLLYITAARYLLVTKILYEQSDGKLKPCVKRIDKKYEIPDSGVCFPVHYGSATCTSDYDVGLIGKNAGILTKKFNEYFQAPRPNGFGRPSEFVFDTNIYAFTLEFSLPSMFVKLLPSFKDGVALRERMINYKMQELASAYYKVFKYNGGFFNTLVAGTRNAMGASKYKDSLNKLNYWLNKFNALQVPLRVQDFDNAEALRIRHNDRYQQLVEGMSNRGYDPKLLDTLAEALIYAAEVYHTRGAIRHVVGGTQMRVVDMSEHSKDLSTNDLWVSMIENWGEANKEYNHYCGVNADPAPPMVTCFLRMSKYMRRMFTAMRMIRARVPKPHSLVRFGEQFGDAEHLSTMWLKFKKEGNFNVQMNQEQIKDVRTFLKQFGCNQAVQNLDLNQVNTPLPPACLQNMNGKVNEYNVKLAALTALGKI